MPGPTPADLRARAAQLRAEAKSALRSAGLLEREADALEARARRFLESTLPQPTEYATIATMATNTAAPPENRRRGARLTSKGPVATVARALHISVAEVAKRIGENYGTARNWDKRGRVPDDVRAKLAALLESGV